MDLKNNKIKDFIDKNRYVSMHNGDEDWNNQIGITKISVAGFIIMSILNVYQHSYIMLATTLGSALLLILSLLYSTKKKNIFMLKTAFMLIFLVLLTMYAIEGGNKGFAALWIVLVPYVSMIMVDLKSGIFISLYFFCMLILTFIGPLHFLIQYEYEPTFLMRFPFFYLINFIFAIFLTFRIRLYQYELLIKQEELERTGKIDMMTGLINRNGYNTFRKNFDLNQSETVTAVYVDVNGLHTLNNEKGHLAGDQMLMCIADLCREYFPEDYVYRMGGDEILVLSIGGEPGKIAEKACNFNKAVIDCGYSVSYGIKTRSNEKSLGELVEAADVIMLENKAMYYQMLGKSRDK